jgi:hypothetical protein
LSWTSAIAPLSQKMGAARPFRQAGENGLGQSSNLAGGRRLPRPYHRPEA